MSAKDLNMELLLLLSSLRRTRSLSVSASRLGMSLSTASRALRGAREMLGDELFTRSGQMMHPTSRMEELGGFIDRMIADFGRLTSREGFDPVGLDRTFRIAALDGAYSLLVAPAIERARRVAPGARFVTEPISLGTFDALRSGFLDLLVFGTDAETVLESIERRTLGDFGYRLGMREGHPLAEAWRLRGAVTREEIERFPLISFQTPFSRMQPSTTMGWFDDSNLESEVMLPYHFSTALSLLESDGIGLFAAPFARLLERRLRGFASIPFDGFMSFHWRPTLYWHRRTHSDPALQWLRGFIELEARRLAQEEQEERKEAERTEEGPSRSAPAESADPIGQK